MTRHGSGAGVRIAVVDSGWDRTRECAQVQAGLAFVGDEADAAADVQWSCDDHDRFGHGTLVTDLILKRAPEATVLPLRVFDRRLETSAHVICAAVSLAAARGIQLVNLSLGTRRAADFRALYRACELARRAGVVIIAAAGGPPGVSAPATFEPVISVGAALDGTGAPLGEDLVRVDEGPVEYTVIGMQHALGLGGHPKRVAGSSFAAAVVTGHVAALCGGAGVTDLAQVRAVLRRTLGAQVSTCRSRVSV